MGSDFGPMVNEPDRLAGLDDDWYRGVIRNGRPAQGMPTWGTVLSPDQIEDLIALVNAWRQGEEVMPAFNVTELIQSGVYALQENDPDSARMHVSRAMMVSDGVAADLLENVYDQLAAGDDTGALETLEIFKDQWPLGDPELGAGTYAASCQVCHGVDGEGGGGGAFPAMKPNEFVQNMTNAELVAFIQEGRAGTAMAGFGSRLTEDEIANVVAFLRLWQP
jgi:mono/diheme cytochrome c family protein